jgi:hypothetical protein
MVSLFLSGSQIVSGRNFGLQRTLTQSSGGLVVASCCRRAVDGVDLADARHVHVVAGEHAGVVAYCRQRGLLLLGADLDFVRSTCRRTSRADFETWV